MPEEDDKAIKLRGSWDQMGLDVKRDLINRMALIVDYDTSKNSESQPDEWVKLFEKINSDFGGSIDEHELKSEMNRVMNSTVFSKNKKANSRLYGGPPTKDTMHNLANTLEAHKALAEIFDNIIDNYIKNIKNGLIDYGLEISFEVHYKNGIHHYIVIKENSGGISEEKWDALNQPGVSLEAQNAVSTFGMGTKISLCSLGFDNYISTNHIIEKDPTYFNYTPDYYSKENTVWEVPAYVVEEGWIYDHPGSSEYKIGYPNALTPNGKRFGLSSHDETYVPQDNLHPVKHLCHWFGLIYSKQFKLIQEELGKTFTFTIMSPVLDKPLSVEPITIDSYEDISIGLSYPEDSDIYAVLSKHELRKPEDWKFVDPIFIEPLIIQKQFQFETTDTLGETRQIDISANAKIGMTEKLWKDDSGVTMWGNNRLFCRNATDEFLPGAGRFNRKINGATTGRVFVFLELHAENPRDIPWNSPIKWAYNNQHPTHKPLQSWVRAITYRYLELANQLSGKGQNWYLDEVIIEEEE